jgi:hypothetical protein
MVWKYRCCGARYSRLLTILGLPDNHPRSPASQLNIRLAVWVTGVSQAQKLCSALNLTDYMISRSDVAVCGVELRRPIVQLTEEPD